MCTAMQPAASIPPRHPAGIPSEDGFFDDALRSLTCGVEQVFWVRCSAGRPDVKVLRDTTHELVVVWKGEVPRQGVPLYEFSFVPDLPGTYRIAARYPHGQKRSAKDQVPWLPGACLPGGVREVILVPDGVWGFGEGLLTHADKPVSLAGLFPDLGGGHTIIAVAASQQHVVALASSGVAFAFGALNTMGELGVGDFEPRTKLTRVSCRQLIRSVTCRDGATAFITLQGTVMCCGLATLGAGRREYACVPTVPPGMETVAAKDVYFCGDSAMALQATGLVVEFGSFGRTAAPFRARRAAQFGAIASVRLLSVTLSHRFAISHTGQLYSAEGGNELRAELGIVDEKSNAVCLVGARQRETHPLFAQSSLLPMRPLRTAKRRRLTRTASSCRLATWWT